MKHINVLGLMSGTSMDGLDCGLFDIVLSPDYQLQWKCKDFKTIPYSQHTRHLIYKALAGGVKGIMNAHNHLGQIFTSSVKEFLKK